MDIEKPEITTGKPQEPTPILADESVSTAVKSKHAPQKQGSASIKIGLILSLLQGDCLDLQQNGLKIAILARDGQIYIRLNYPDHALGFDTGNITLDGQKVNDIE